MNTLTPSKRRCASVRLATNSTPKPGHEDVVFVGEYDTPLRRCSTASPLIPTTSSIEADNFATPRRSPELRDKPLEQPTVVKTSDSLPDAGSFLPKGRKPAAARIAELLAELEMVEDGTHPKLIEKQRELLSKQEDEQEMIDIMYEREKDLIERKYQMEHAAIQKELKEREEELVQAMLMEIDDRARFIEAEVAVLDVAGPACPTFSMNKKCLRRRPHDTPSSTEKKKARSAAPAIIHLLPEHIIAEDVRLLAPAESIPSVVQHHKVSLDNGKLIYEGKTYQRGQALVVQTENYGAFAGMILAMCEQYIQFRSTVPGDTRQVLATMDDLESGRVILRKKIT